MAKCLLLLLLVVLSSLLGLPQALECFQCDRVNTSGVCVSGGGTCQTQDGQQCFLRKIYEEGNGNPLQCSCLENPRDGGARWAALCGVAQSRTRLKRRSSSSSSSSETLSPASDGTLSYGRQGCSQLCTPMKLFNPNVIVEYKCCHDSPLCNKF